VPQSAIFTDTATDNACESPRPTSNNISLETPGQSDDISGHSLSYDNNSAAPATELQHLSPDASAREQSLASARRASPGTNTSSVHPASDNKENYCDDPASPGSSGRDGISKGSASSTPLHDLNSTVNGSALKRMVCEMSDVSGSQHPEHDSFTIESHRRRDDPEAVVCVKKVCYEAATNSLYGLDKDDGYWYLLYDTSLMTRSQREAIDEARNRPGELSRNHAHIAPHCCMHPR